MGSVGDLAAFEQVEPVAHRLAGGDPFSDHEDVAGAELVNRLLEFGTVFAALAGGFSRNWYRRALRADTYLTFVRSKRSCTSRFSSFISNAFRA